MTAWRIRLRLTFGLSVCPFVCVSVPVSVGVCFFLPSAFLFVRAAHLSIRLSVCPFVRPRASERANERVISVGSWAQLPVPLTFKTQSWPTSERHNGKVTSFGAKCLSICWAIRSFVPSSVRPSVRLSIHPSFVRSFARPFVRSSVRSFIRSPARPTSKDRLTTRANSSGQNSQ